MIKFEFEGTIDELLAMAQKLAPAPTVENKWTPLPGHFLVSLLREFKAGNKIGAIKAVREITNLGLKESKDLVESV